MNNSEITSELGKAWRELAPQVKRKYISTAEENNKKFKENNPHFLRKQKSKESQYITKFRICGPAQQPTKKKKPNRTINKLSDSGSPKILPPIEQMLRNIRFNNSKVEFVLKPIL